MKLKTFLLLIIFSVGISAQDFLNGKINELNNGKEIPLVGANIHWLGTTVGTTSDDNRTKIIEVDRDPFTGKNVRKKLHVKTRTNRKGETVLRESLD